MFLIICNLVAEADLEIHFVGGRLVHVLRALFSQIRKSKDPTSYFAKGIKSSSYVTVLIVHGCNVLFEIISLKIV